tara:strand:+ start:1270 stop:1458 length:189 start_codon:yes stop_codon:yes gene_type:complete
MHYGPQTRSSAVGTACAKFASEAQNVIMVMHLQLSRTQGATAARYQLLISVGRWPVSPLKIR